MYNHEHWKKFYESAPVLERSDFAAWCATQGGLTNRRVVEFGCGNGRDTRYLRGCNRYVHGVDPFAPRAGSFSQMSIEEFTKKWRNRPINSVNAVYCRFLLHSIDDNAQQLLLDWTRRNRATLYAEFRTDKDVPLVQDHRRRLINTREFLQQLLDYEFNIEYFKSGYDMAQLGEENPHVARVVAS